MDSGWLARAQKGDAEAFAKAFEALRSGVFAVACRLAGPDDAVNIALATSALDQTRKFRAAGDLDAAAEKLLRDAVPEAMP